MLLQRRMRRNRKLSAIRSLVQENTLQASDFIIPIFIVEGQERREMINSMPGIERLSLDLVYPKLECLMKLGVCSVVLFPVISENNKDEEGSFALNDSGIMYEAIRNIKNKFPELCLIADLALDPFTSHGHDGWVDNQGNILNDETVEQLKQVAILQAQAGADIIAPSDMMDGRIKAIRNGLDLNNFHQVGLLSYTAKYASSLYSPFREALNSNLKFGDKYTYQLNPANGKEALFEAQLDVEEGADILMVKPALSYLDIIYRIKSNFNLPVAAYHVSGEYSMVIAAHNAGYLDAKKVFYESLISIKRAGADMIMTYAFDWVSDRLV